MNEKEELKKLARLLHEGAITRQQYLYRKKRILSRLNKYEQQTRKKPLVVLAILLLISVIVVVSMTMHKPSHNYVKPIVTHTNSLA